MICGGAAVLILIGHGRLTVASVSVAVAAVVGTLAIPAVSAASLAHGPFPTAYGRWTGGESVHTVGAMLATTHTKWSAAVVGSEAAAALEIVSGTSVMAIGGYRNDPVPTLEQFIDYVRAGMIAYYVGPATNGVAPPPSPELRPHIQGSSNSQQIANWVAEHYPAVTVGKSLAYYRLT